MKYLPYNSEINTMFFPSTFDYTHLTIEYKPNEIINPDLERHGPGTGIVG